MTKSKDLTAVTTPKIKCLHPQRMGALLLLAVAASALFWPLTRTQSDSSTRLDPVPEVDGGWIATGNFRIDGSYAGTAHHLIDSRIPMWGSWAPAAQDSSLTSPWFDSAEGLVVGVAGFLRSGSTIEIQWRDGDETTTHLLPDGIMREQPRIVSLQTPDTGQVRLVARSTGSDWVGITPPLSLDTDVTAALFAAFRTVGTTALALALVMLPGLLLRRRSGSLSKLSATVPLIGAIGCAAAGLAIWAGSAFISPRLLSTAGCACILVTMSWLACRGSGALLDRSELIWVALLGAVVVLGAGRLIWSAGPQGELYEGTVSRAYEIGDRSDGRIPFHVIQLSNLRAGPNSPTATTLYPGWGFSTRPPTAGLAASVVAFATGANPDITAYNARWKLFDEQGFMAFRLASLVLAATSIWAVGALGQSLGGARAGRYAACLFALSPFVIHETLFPWPKLIMTTAVIGAAQALVLRRPAVAGLLCGIGFLFHPAALPMAPALLLLAVAISWTKPLRFVEVVRSVGAFTAGLAAVYLSYRLINLGNFTQDGFFVYFLLADGSPARDPLDWIMSRVEIVGNTFIPGAQWLTRRGAANLNPYSGDAAPDIVRWHIQYWTVAPFAAGVLAAPAILTGLFQMVRRRSAVLFIVLIAPLVMFVTYWGFTSSGVMREGLHAWLAGVLVLAAWGLAEMSTRHLRAATVLMRLSMLRIVEILAMLLLPALTTGPLIRPADAPGDVTALALMALGTFALVGSAWVATTPKGVKRTRPESRSRTSENASTAELDGVAALTM